MPQAACRSMSRWVRLYFAAKASLHWLEGMETAICRVAPVSNSGMQHPTDPGQGVQHSSCMQAFLQSTDSDAMQASRPHWQLPACTWPVPASFPKSRVCSQP